MPKTLKSLQYRMAFNWFYLRTPNLREATPENEAAWREEELKKEQSHVKKNQLLFKNLMQFLQPFILDNRASLQELHLNIF